MGLADFIGERGEAIATKQLAMFCRENADLPYFILHHLGEKCRTFDYLVEVMSRAIPSITTAHELTPESLRRLRDEVREFWNDRGRIPKTSFFKN